MNRGNSPYGEDAYGRQFGNVQPGPADYQLDQRLSLSGGSKQRNPAQISSGENKTDGWRGMYRAQGHRPARGETVTEQEESFVTVAPSDPDSGEDLTSWNLLDCLESFRQAAVFLYLRLMLRCFLLHHSSVSRGNK